LTQSAAELNSDKFVALNEHSPEFCVCSDGRVLTYDEMVGMNRAAFRRLKSNQIMIDTVHTRVLGPDMVVAFGPFHQSITDTAGVNQRLKGEALWIARRTNGQWKVIFAQSSHQPDVSSD
jgi:hypothetical protein